MSTLKIIQETRASLQLIKRIRKFEDEKEHPIIPWKYFIFCEECGNGVQNNKLTRRCLIGNIFNEYLKEVIFKIWGLIIFLTLIITNMPFLIFILLFFVPYIVVSLYCIWLIYNLYYYIAWPDEDDCNDDEEDNGPEFFPPKWPSPKTKFQKLNIHPKTNPRALSRK